MHVWSAMDWKAFWIIKLIRSKVTAFSWDVLVSWIHTIIVCAGPYLAPICSFETIYYCQHPLASVNGTIYYCQHTQFKSLKYSSDVWLACTDMMLYVQSFKIFRTSRNGPGPDLPEKECDKMVPKTCQILTMLNADVCFVLSIYYWVFIKCELYRKVNPLGEEKSLIFCKQF